MSEWREINFGEIATFRNGLNFKNDSHGKGCKIIGIPDFGDKLIPNYESLGEINPDGIVKKEDYLQIGDIIFVRSNGNKNLVGRSLFISQIKKPLVYSGFCIRARVDQDKATPLFLAYFFRTTLFRKMISGAAGGANIQNLNQGLLNRSIIPLPSLSTQERIASILSAYDDLIENNLKRIRLLEEVAQRTYEEWFVKFKINGEKLKIGKSGLPNGWERKPFNSIVEIISGFAFKSSDYVENGQYKIVTIKNVQDGYFVTNTTDSLDKIPKNVKSSQILKTEDFILSLTGNVGRVCMVHGENYLLNQRVAKVQSKNKIHKSFVYYFLRSKSTLTNFINLSNGAAQQNLSPVNMGNMNIVIPPEEILDLFAEKFDGTLRLICNLNLQIASLKESRDILLPRLMSRKITVGDVLGMVAERGAEYK